MNLTRNYMSLGKKGRSGQKFSKDVIGIIIHWIGPYPNQRPSAVRNWWEMGTDGQGVVASAHFAIRDRDVLQCLPLNEIGWHSGDERNYSMIGIEVCPANTRGEFSDITVETLKELVEHIREVHPGAIKLQRHFDGKQGKDCPRFYTRATSLFDGGGRVANPEGGDLRWRNLVDYLNGKIDLDTMSCLIRENTA